MLHPSFIKAVEHSWCKDTPVHSQSLVTSLAVWAVYGGDIIVGRTDRITPHFCNVIDGKQTDLIASHMVVANPIDTRIAMQRAFQDNTLYTRLRVFIARMAENGFQDRNLKADAVLRHFKLSHPNLFRANPQPPVITFRP